MRTLTTFSIFTVHILLFSLFYENRTTSLNLVVDKKKEESELVEILEKIDFIKEDIQRLTDSLEQTRILLEAAKLSTQELPIDSYQSYFYFTAGTCLILLGVGFFF